MVTKTDTSPTDISFLSKDDPVPDEAGQTYEPPTYQPNMTALASAGGNHVVWGHEVSEMVHALTGSWISEDTFAAWFGMYAEQVRGQAMRAALFQVANAQLPPTTQGDPAILLLQLRDDLAAGLRRTAGL